MQLRRAARADRRRAEGTSTAANGTALLGVVALAAGFDVVLVAGGTWWAVLVLVGLSLLGRRWFQRVGVVSVAVGPDGVQLLDADLVQRFERGEVGAVGVWRTGRSGRLRAGRTDPGQVVVLDPWGRVAAARISRGMAVAALRRACEAQGVRWVGEVEVDAGRLAAAGWPEGVELPPGPPAASDGSAEAALAGAARSARRRGTAYGLATVGVLAVGWAVTRSSTSTLAVDVVRAACLLVFVDAVLELGQVALDAGHLRAAHRILSVAGWRPVDVVVVQGAPADRGAVASVELDPDSGAPRSSWLVEGGTGAWPPSSRRGWLLLAEEPDGERAVLAEPDRSELAVVRANGGFLRADAIHRWAREQARPAPGRAGPAGGSGGMLGG